MAHQFQITEFRAQHLQALRNVTIHSPSIIPVSYTHLTLPTTVDV